MTMPGRAHARYFEYSKVANPIDPQAPKIPTAISIILSTNTENRGLFRST